MAIKVELFSATSTLAAHPQVEVDVPAGYKIIGGGALDSWSSTGGPGNLLTASYPQGMNTWFAAGKDHEFSSPSTITGFALAIADPHDEWEVFIASETAGPNAHPTAVATLPFGYVLTGGGAFVNWSGAGNLLTASFPNGDMSWEARSKDHDISDPASITAYAIGLKHRTHKIKVVNTVQNATGDDAPHPTATVCLGPGWALSGGGALDNWNGAGNLLSASYPQGACWHAEGKDHNDPSPATMTSYAIGIRQS